MHKYQRKETDQNMPDKLPKKHLFVAVQAVNYEVHKATDLKPRQKHKKVRFKPFKLQYKI